MVRVKISDGILEGEKVRNEYGGKFYSFKGIPYAKPPVGDLRFKEPQPVEPWTGVKSVKKFGPICYQVDPGLSRILHNNMDMSEDCLYLNVYTPNIEPETPLTVMVWIHGGGFAWGSGNDHQYGPEFIVRHNVVLVTINYRLEVLGFLCLDTPEVPGNAGMKDQVAALKWVKKNISHFGGDPDNITIFGESAGAGSVSYHLISPMSKGLFKRAIAQSGAVTCFWAKAFEPREKAVALAKKLGLNSEDDKELYEFFKKQPVENLVHVKLPVTLSEKSYSLHFAIADEQDFGQERFFYGDVADALRNGIHEDVEVLTGYNKDEGLMAIAVMGLPAEDVIALANKYREFFTPNLIKLNCVTSKQLQAARKMHKFYFDNLILTMKDYQQLVKFLNMDMFVHGILLAAKLISKKNKIFLYKFTCYTELNTISAHVHNKDPSAVCHADDVHYLFTMKAFEQQVECDSEIFGLVDRMTKLWTNFAKHGDPTSGDCFDVKWKPYTLESEEYLEICNELSAKTSPDKEEMDFWNSIFKEYLPNYSI